MTHANTSNVCLRLFHWERSKHINLENITKSHSGACLTPNLQSNIDIAMCMFAFLPRCKLGNFPVGIPARRKIQKGQVLPLKPMGIHGHTFKSEAQAFRPPGRFGT